LWAQWFAALAVPIAAVVGVALGILNYALSIKKRYDDLFDARFQLFQRFMELLSNPERFEVGGVEYKRLNMTKISYEFEFLYSPEIAEHVRTVEEWIGEPRSKHNIEDIIRPFRQFLRR
jgi:hypothetical protein